MRTASVGPWPLGSSGLLRASEENPVDCPASAKQPAAQHGREGLRNPFKPWHSRDLLGTRGGLMHGCQCE